MVTKGGETLVEYLVFVDTQEDDEVVDADDSSESEASVFEFTNGERLLRL